MACGWTDIGFARFGGTGLDPLDGLRDDLPDYLNDLNAMHEAEKKLLTVNQQNRYQTEIAEICWSDEERGNNQVVFNQLTASATQRAEAFLRTLNLWTE